MTCDDFRQEISEFIDAELPQRDLRSLFEHLATCDGCWKYYRRLERMHNVLQKPIPAVIAASPGREVQGKKTENWMRQRITVNPASFVLNGVVTFLLGALLTAALSRVDWTSPAERNAEQMVQRSGSGDYFSQFHEPLARPWRNSR